MADINISSPSSTVDSPATDAAAGSSDRLNGETIGEQQTSVVIFPLRPQQVKALVKGSRLQCIDTRRFSVAYHDPEWIWYYTGRPASEIRYVVRVNKVITNRTPNPKGRGPPKVVTDYLISELWELNSPKGIEELKERGFITVSKWAWAENWLVSGIKMEEVATRLW